MTLAISTIFENLLGGQELIDLLLSLPAVLLAICVHEYSHARVAYHFGDPTAKLCGRMTLNPIRHFHPIGFLLLVFARVGFAKPVPINPNNFKNRRRDEIWVSLAGPLSNIVMFILFTVALKLYLAACNWQGLILQYGGNSYFATDWTYYVYIMLFYGMLVNLSLALFNMIPLPPLDGSHLLTVLLPRKWMNVYHKLQPFMPYIFIAVWVTGGLGWLVSKPVSFILSLVL